MFNRRRTRPPGQCQVNRMRDLGSEPMKCQCGNKTHNPLRDALGHGRQIRVPERRQIRQAVDAARQSFKLTRISHRVKDSRMNARRERLSGTQNSPVAPEGLESCLQCGSDHLKPGWIKMHTNTYNCMLFYPCPLSNEKPRMRLEQRPLCRSPWFSECFVFCTLNSRAKSGPIRGGMPLGPLARGPNIPTNVGMPAVLAPLEIRP